MTTMIFCNKSIQTTKPYRFFTDSLSLMTDDAKFVGSLSFLLAAVKYCRNPSTKKHSLKMAAHCASTNTWRSAQRALTTTPGVINLRYATPDVHRINGRACCGCSFADTPNESRPFAMISSESCIDCARLPWRHLRHPGQCHLELGTVAHDTSPGGRHNDDCHRSIACDKQLYCGICSCLVFCMSPC